MTIASAFGLTGILFLCVSGVLGGVYTVAHSGGYGTVAAAGAKRSKSARVMSSLAWAAFGVSVVAFLASIWAAV